jgi:hypothetical protein
MAWHVGSGTVVSIEPITSRAPKPTANSKGSPVRLPDDAVDPTKTGVDGTGAEFISYPQPLAAPQRTRLFNIIILRIQNFILAILWLEFSCQGNYI